MLNFTPLKKRLYTRVKHKRSRSSKAGERDRPQLDTGEQNPRIMGARETSYRSRLVDIGLRYGDMQQSYVVPTGGQVEPTNQARARGAYIESLQDADEAYISPPRQFQTEGAPRFYRASGRETYSPLSCIRPDALAWLSSEVPDMDSDEKAKEYFNIFVFKVEPCPQKNKHPWDSCNFCHPQENARRRDVRKFRYLAEACPDYKLHGFCALGNSCPFAHGVFEINLHPSKYRTQICTEGSRCSRKVCFFAHNEGQLRQPDYSFGYKSAAEAERVKERLLAEGNAHLLQVAPGTPPQQVTPPRSFGGGNSANSVAEAFRALPGALPSSTSPFIPSPNSNFSHSMGKPKGIGGWGMPTELDAPQAADRNAMFDMLPLGGGSCDTATTQYLRSKAQQTRSLPADGGPRISMKVRRELGLDAPGRHRASSLPGLTTGSFSHSPAVSLAGAGLPMSAGLPSNSLPDQLNAPLHSLAPLNLLQTTGGSLSSMAGSLPLNMPSGSYKPEQHGARALRVVAPSGVTLGVDEALAQLGLSVSNDGTNDLSFIASALGVLGRLGYSLAPGGGPLHAQEPRDKELAGIGPLDDFAARLRAHQGGILAASDSAPGLAELAMSAGDFVLCP